MYYVNWYNNYIENENCIWYLVLNLVFLLVDMFEICVIIFLIEMFLLVGGFFFVFLGNVYVDLLLLFVVLLCGFWFVLK